MEEDMKKEDICKNAYEWHKVTTGFKKEDGKNYQVQHYSHHNVHNVLWDVMTSDEELEQE